jgi:hypothetical protein
MADIAYNRAGRQRQYVSIAKHQANAHNKHAKWTSVNIERLVFDNADFGNFAHSDNPPSLAWVDNTSNMWGFLQNYGEVGTNREQFGYFENPNNAALPWHGFPVIPFSKSRYSISNALITLWVTSGFMDEDDVPALLGKKRLK